MHITIKESTFKGITIMEAVTENSSARPPDTDGFDMAVINKAGYRELDGYEKGQFLANA